MLLEATLLSTLVDPRIDVYTMGRGEHLFERFGHAAICVVERHDASKGACFNYGTTDFGSPPAELGWEFLRGTARFWVSVSPVDRMLRAYQRADRSIWRQRLNLPPEQIVAIAQKLASDARSDNRYYLYHHFDDNCATRIRDVIDLASGGRLFKTTQQPFEETYRQLGVAALHDESLILFAGDLFVGRRADRLPTRYEAMFMPHVLRETLREELSAQPTSVYRRRSSLPAGVARTWPFWLLLSGMTALLSIGWHRTLRPRFRTLLRVLSVFPVGLLGLAVWSVAAISRVPELSTNEALAIFWPLDLLLLLLPQAWRWHYARLRVVSLVAVLLLFALEVLRQPLLLAAVVPLLAWGSIWLSEALPRSAGRGPQRFLGIRSQ